MKFHHSLQNLRKPLAIKKIDLAFTPELTKWWDSSMLMSGNDRWWVWWCVLELREHLFTTDKVFHKCCGSITFWCGSGSGSGFADLCLWLTEPEPDPDSDLDADPDPSIFIIDLDKKLIYKKVFLLLLFEGTFTWFFKVKKSNSSHKTVEIKVFLTIFAQW